MSAAPGPDVLRAAVRRAVETSSLRAVAGEIGLSHGGLSRFLDGNSPREATLRKLREWYVRRGPDASAPPVAVIDAALAVLLADLSPSARAEALSAIADAISRAHRKSGGTPPGWVSRLSASS